MGSLDFGKITTIVILFFIGVYFFGDKALYWYNHQDDLKFKMSKIVYTKEDFLDMDKPEKDSVLAEISSLCVRKHAVDKLSCEDTSYWLGDGLEKKGVQLELTMELMKTCIDSCETGKYDPSLYIEVQKATDKSTEKSEGTKWIWDED